MRLLDLPSEILVVVTDNLHGYEVILLYSTGSHVLRLKLSNGGVRRLQISGMPSSLYKTAKSHKSCTHTHCCCIVRYQALFPKVESIVYAGETYSRSWVSIVLPTLGSNLNSLYLSFLGNLVYFSSLLWNQNIYFCELLPKLRTLTLHASRSTPHWDENNSVMTDFFLATLPRDLIRFQVKCGVLQFEEEVSYASKLFAAELPQKLEILGFCVVGDTLEERCLKERVHLASIIPQRLKPEHMQHVCLKKAELPQHWPLFLPSSLTELSFRQSVGRYNTPAEPSDFDWISFLPKALAKFDCTLSCTIPVHLLPRTLTSLKLRCKSQWDNSLLPLLTSLSTSVWPPKNAVPVLTSLSLMGSHLPYFLKLDRFYETLEWPENLKSLNISHRAVGISRMLPASVTSLTLDMDYSTSPIYIKDAYLPLPASLIHLVLNRICSVQIAFFDRQWPPLLETLILTYSCNGPDRPNTEVADTKVALEALERLPKSITHLRLDWNVTRPLGSSACFPPNLRILGLKSTPFEISELLLLPTSLTKLNLLEIRCGAIDNQIDGSKISINRNSRTYDNDFIETLKTDFSLLPQVVDHLSAVNLGLIPIAIPKHGENILEYLWGPGNVVSNLMTPQSSISAILPNIPFCKPLRRYLRHFKLRTHGEPPLKDSFCLLKPQN